MPWYSNCSGYVTTSTDCGGGSWWGTLTPEELLFRPANDFVRIFFTHQRLQLELQSVRLKSIWDKLPPKWSSDPMPSELQFKIKHLMISNVSGALKNFSAEVEAEDENFSTAKISLTAQMDSISTNNEQRDVHLRNSDFFEVGKYPELKFKSTKVQQADSDSFVLHGELTMKGVTKPVRLNVEFNGATKDPWGSERAGFTITGKINGADWGINFNSVLETGGVVLGEEIRIYSEIELVKQEVGMLA
jgi:polyisoprenoid-binding protein YceI